MTKQSILSVLLRNEYLQINKYVESFSFSQITINKTNSLSLTNMFLSDPRQM